MNPPGEGTPLPSGYHVRPGALADLEAVHEVITAVDIAVVGEPDTTQEELRSEWNRPRFDVRRDVDVVVTETGRIVGYLSVHEESPGLELRADVYVHPELEQLPICRHLTERAVVRAQLAADRAQTRLALLVWAVADEPLTADLEVTGFELRRHFWRMAIELDDVELHDAPVGLTLTPLDAERDVVEVHEVLTEAFSNHWGSHAQTLEDWRAHHLGRADADPSLWRVARRDGAVVGAVIARSEEADGVVGGWISTVGVRENARGQGVAEALLRSVFAGLADRGLTRAQLGVDSQNETGATHLYERAGMHVAFELQAWVRDVEPTGERTA